MCINVLFNQLSISEPVENVELENLNDDVEVEDR